MKPENLREFAEKLYVNAPRHEEFAKEILDLIEMEENSIEAEIVEELEHHCPKEMHAKGPRKMAEYLGDRGAVLTEIEKKITDTAPILRRWGIPARAIKDVDDTVGDLLDILEDVELALNAEGLTGNILDMLAELREKVPDEPAEKPMVYDL